MSALSAERFVFDPDGVMVPCAHFISGRRIEGPGVLPVARPSDGVVYAELPEAGVQLVDRAVANADQAFRGSEWRRQPPRERARILRRWADLIEADIDELAQLEALGSSRPIEQARGWDVPYTAEGIRFFAEFADKHGGEVASTATSSLGMQIAEPMGVVAAIAPWNFPLAMTCWKIAPALAAGNCVVLKPSELTPFSAVRLAELAIRAGMPPGVFNLVQGSGPLTGDALCRHPQIEKVTFTGSTATGRSIMAACAEHGPRPVTLELGGKSPQLVFADIPDIDRTARTLARGITGNAGQVCVAGSRLVIARSLLEPMVARLTAEFAHLQPGPTWQAGSPFSPIISPLQLDRIESVVARARGAGARLLCGGERFAPEQMGGGCFYRPTLLAADGRDNPAVSEEIFGPVLTVQTFEDEEEALALAEHEVYGLAAGVHTADLNRALRAVRRLSAGTVWVNRYGRSHDYILPTGGYKCSGIGRDLGRAAFEANLRHKSVLFDIEA